ncbi:MAG: NYN domain-containing protein [Nitrospirota bacterium]
MTEEGRAISYIIIDGYNLIGIYHKDLSGQRDALINSMIKYRKIKGHEIIIVFDGWKTGSNKEEHIGAGGIKVIYSKLGEKADSVIKRIISREKREWIVISSDRDITSYAWSSGSVPVPSEEFLSAVEKAGESLSGEYELFEEEDAVERKGNPRKLSKKEKALRRVLGKL